MIDFVLPTGEAEEHVLLHLLPVHQRWQSAVYCHHPHPQRYISGDDKAYNTPMSHMLHSQINVCVFPAQECGINTKQSCYPLAFGVPAALMVVALGKIYICFYVFIDCTKQINSTFISNHSWIIN